jgi:hypothetical protein
MMEPLLISLDLFPMKVVFLMHQVQILEMDILQKMMDIYGSLMVQIPGLMQVKSEDLMVLLVLEVIQVQQVHKVFKVQQVQ